MLFLDYCYRQRVFLQLLDNHCLNINCQNVFLRALSETTVWKSTNTLSKFQRLPEEGATDISRKHANDCG